MFLYDFNLIVTKFYKGLNILPFQAPFLYRWFNLILRSSSERKDVEICLSSVINNEDIDAIMSSSQT